MMARIKNVKGCISIVSGVLAVRVLLFAYGGLSGLWQRFFG